MTEARGREGVLAGIGGTPLIELRKVVPSGSARVLAKLEWANPTGSMKDRMALAVIEGAERAGLLEPGDTVVEYTAGTTGISLAFVCAAKGYRFHAVFSDAFSVEKRRTMEAFGAIIDRISCSVESAAGRSASSPATGGATSSTTATPSPATTGSATRCGSSRVTASTRSFRRCRRHTASTGRRARCATTTPLYR